MPTSNLQIIKADAYNKAIKKLKKRFPHIENDIDLFFEQISTLDELGIHLGNNVYKARIANSDKNSGKSGGYRLISYLKIINNEIYLLFVYDKSDYENIKESDIDAIVANSVDNF
jgi:hypothetical protein